ncbi:SDR family oxidoreductase [Aspergillus saccharolyticus JOP 1030-1]|uniref:Putative cinnamoyl-CoA reductase n=1 Tax=Aspergillus saccharolyticus JOP 1030-1 TaxID=1450539 RepID=A0A318ZAE8_9EURO|nr:putative cinnamoyl-CoA reductase [Aspergillus saccharolyticus JOP 1030-1]PYH40460.1 putative cinnamoyl-CoA reductase [Aspergillus saccharolyticus JOP 1030-1]
MPETLLVTGASGFVASHIIQRFLEAGYNIRGTVRSASTAETVKSRYPPDQANRLSFTIVPDIAAPGAFDSAVKDVCGVIHTASPFALTVADNEKDLLQPAIQGTLNVLDSIAAHGTAVRRVVVTSSFAAILDLSQGLRPGYRYTEADWNPCTYEEAKTTTDASVAYCASKALAERKLWEWVESAAPPPTFSVTTICPPWIFGPALGNPQHKGNNRLNESTETIWNLVNGSRTEVPDHDFLAFANVKDVAEAHYQAYTRAEAGGERFLVAGGRFLYQEACGILREKFPQLGDKVPYRANAGSVETYIADGSKAERVLGLQYRSLEETLVETVEDLLKRFAT